MKYIEAGDARVPALGLGTSALDGRECIDAVLHALDIGYRHVDTAGDYDNEREVGTAIEQTDVPRDDIFLTTKLWRNELGYEDALAAAERSIDTLKTDYVDLLLVHWPNEDVPLESTLEALQALQEAGRTRHIGVSNFTPSLLEEALDLAPIVCNQVEYHPLLAQDRLLEMARANDMVLTAYSPLAQGAALDERVVREIADAHDRTPAQIVLRWLVQQDNVAAIPRSSSARHREENLRVFDFELSDDEMRRIAGLNRGARQIDPAFAPAWGH